MFNYGRLRPAIDARPDRDSGDQAAIAEANRRLRNRINCVLLECELGTVINLSLTGMRVRCHKKVTPPPADMQPMRMTLRLDERTLPIEGKVAWARRSGIAGLGPFELGIEFVNIDDTKRAQIARFARESLDCEIVRPRD